VHHKAFGCKPEESGVPSVCVLDRLTRLTIRADPGWRVRAAGWNLYFVR